MNAPSTIALIARREVRQRLRSRLFVATTLLLAIALTALAALPAVLGVFSTDPPDTADAEPPPVVRIGVLGELADTEEAALGQALGPIETEHVADEDAAIAALTRDDEPAALVVEPGSRVLTVPSVGPFGPGGQAQRAAEALGLLALFDDVGTVGEILDRPSLPVEQVSEVPPAEATARLVVANIAVVFIFAVLIMYSSMIINGVIEEKGSRVVEVLVATVPVRWLLAGKLLGLGLVGAGQTAFLFGPPLLVLVLTAGEDIPPGIGGLALAVAAWFVAGYALYAVLAAGLGSLVSRPEEAQAVLTPVNVLMIGGYLVGFIAVNAPTSTWATVASFVPFSAPYAMLVRQALASPAWWEVLVAYGGTLLTAGLATLLAARIYAGAILRVGARVRLRDAWSSV